MKKLWRRRRKGVNAAHICILTARSYDGSSRADAECKFSILSVSCECEVWHRQHLGFFLQTKSFLLTRVWRVNLHIHSYAVVKAKLVILFLPLLLRSAINAYCLALARSLDQPCTCIKYCIKISDEDLNDRETFKTYCIGSVRLPVKMPDEDLLGIRMCCHNAWVFWNFPYLIHLQQEDVADNKFFISLNRRFFCLGL